MPEDIDIEHFNRNEKRPDLQTPMPGAIEAEAQNPSVTNAPMVAERLGFKDNFEVNPFIEMKIRAIDEHILGIMDAEHLVNTPSAYNTILNRMLQSVGDSVERMVRGGENVKLLDSLFRQVAFANGLSSKTYQERYSKKYADQKIAKQLTELGKTLSLLKNN